MQSPFWCPAHGFAHRERLADHRPDCAHECDVFDPPGLEAPPVCVGKPGKGQGKRFCAYHGLIHFGEKD
jgi:hypothetical protein